MMVQIFDVGHGACSVITCPNGARVMVDCEYSLDPNWFPSVAFMGETIELPVLNNLDEDHVNDLPYVARNVRIRSLRVSPD